VHATPLAGGTPSDEQLRRVFARKTYRTFKGGPLDLAAVAAALTAPVHRTAHVNLNR